MNNDEIESMAETASPSTLHYITKYITRLQLYFYIFKSIGLMVILPLLGAFTGIPGIGFLYFPIFILNIFLATKQGRYNLLFKAFPVLDCGRKDCLFWNSRSNVFWNPRIYGQIIGYNYQTENLKNEPIYQSLPKEIKKKTEKLSKNPHTHATLCLSKDIDFNDPSYYLVIAPEEVRNLKAITGILEYCGPYTLSDRWGKDRTLPLYVVIYADPNEQELAKEIKGLTPAFKGLTDLIVLNTDKEVLERDNKRLKKQVDIYQQQITQLGQDKLEWKAFSAEDPDNTKLSIDPALRNILLFVIVALVLALIFMVIF